MRKLALLLVVPSALALPSPATAASICSHVRTTGTVLGDREVTRRCVNNPLPRYICTDSSPGVPQAGVDVRLCTPAP